jgi:hexosaminidase
MMGSMKTTFRISLPAALLAVLLLIIPAPKGADTMERSSLPLVPAPRSWVPSPDGLLETAGAPVRLAPGTRDDGEARFDGREVVGPEAESYRLEITPSGLVISAGHPAGVFRARQTARQLLESGLAELPCGVIEDSPRFAWRGMLLDCGRHFMPLEQIKRTIDQLALHKFNVLHWHLTEDQGWRMEVPQYPRLQEVAAWRTHSDGQVYGGYYTTEEMQEIVAYAAERFMVVVPEIELPGHSVAALAAYPELSCTGGPFEVETQWGIHEDVYCAGNEEVFVFLENVFRRAMGVFPSTFIHIGGDECPKERWMACGKCQQRIAAEGLKDEHELQSWFIQRMEFFLRQHGRRLIGWDEILEGGLAQGGSSKASVQSWRGVRGAVAAARSGHHAVVSPTSHAYFDYDVGVTDLHQVFTFDPVPDNLSAEEAHYIMGGEMNLWTEYIPPERLESMVFPRALAMAEALWTADPDRDFLEFYPRAMAHARWLQELGVDVGPVARPVRTEFQQGGVVFSLDEKLPPDLLSLRWKRLPANVHYDPGRRVEEQDIPDLDFVDQPVRGLLALPSGPALLAAQAFLGDEPYGEPTVIKLEDHLARGIAPRLENQASSRYPGGGPGGLTNGLRGSLDYRDGHWSGFEGMHAEGVVDLGEMKELRLLELGCFQSANDWIFFPTQVAFMISSDGENWQEAGTVTNPHSHKLQRKFIHPFGAELVNETRARFVRFKATSRLVCPDWHPGAGGPCWVFLDELVVR